jgi:hypothetical protein
MAVADILSRLDRVRKTGKDSWIACCPAHEDRSPSLTIRETDDGKTLLHCFTGCSIHDIVAALGMDLSDLFPPRPADHSIKPNRRPFPAADILRAIAFEALVVVTAGTVILNGEPVSEGDRERLVVAVGRIQSALDTSGLRHG